jgi:hypothetical protein
MRVQVTDDSGFLALVDPDAYSGYVREDWVLEEILRRLREEMAARHLLLWGTGRQGCWTVDAAVRDDVARGVREVIGTIVSSRGRLLLTNYESLTFVAQFAGEPLPQPHETGQVLEVPPGLYACRIVQHVLEAANWQAGCAPEFSLSLRAADSATPAWDRIPWADESPDEG